MEDLQQAHKKRKNRESLLETVESIIVAFILAFIFRAFIIEAFVIPTGSMAPTLYGAHAEYKCSDCGYPFAVGEDSRITAPPLCPNCFQAQAIPPRTDYSGDRILVLKYLYEFQPPRRWDVIVFHNPNEPSQNYIKRLIALPGETLELRYGDVFINGRIARKTDKAQDALWMLVHDTRYRPTRPEWKPRWVEEGPAAAAGWEAKESAFVLAKALDGDRTAWLAYRHLSPVEAPDNIRTSNVMDYYAYDSGSDGAHYGAAVCTDLALRARVVAGQAASVAVAEMRAYKDRFRFELTAKGSGRPSRIWINERVVAQSNEGVLPVGRPIEVLVSNVDHKVMLLVGGSRPVRAVSANVETTPEGDATYEPKPLTDQDRARFDNPSAPEPRNFAYEVRIGAHGGPATLEYLRLDRDVYYLSDSLPNSQRPGFATRGHPFALREGEYFVMGDNSPRSFDSRMWSQIGRPVVPAENLVGKAFFVYWPSAGWRYGVPVAPDPTGWRLVR